MFLVLEKVVVEGEVTETKVFGDLEGYESRGQAFNAIRAAGVTENTFEIFEYKEAAAWTQPVLQVV